MATKYLRLGSVEDVMSYDDSDYDSAVETDAPMKAGAPVDSNDVARKAEVDAILPDQTGNSGKFLQTDGSVVSWQNETSHADVVVDGDFSSNGFMKRAALGSYTVQAVGVSTTYTVVTAIQAGGGGAVGFQYKDRQITTTDGLVTAVGAESSWNDI